MVLTVPGDIGAARRRSAHRRRGTGAVRPGRHGGQQRRDLHCQAIHRLHRRRLRRRHRSEPARLLRGVPRRRRRDAVHDGGGHLVNISTSLVDHANSQVPSALASLTKGGLNAVTKALAIEYADRGDPGQRRRARRHPHPDARPSSYEALAKLHPVGQIGEIDDVVDAVLYLENAPIRHRRDPARRRWPKRRPLIKEVLRGVLDRVEGRHRRTRTADGWPRCSPRTRSSRACAPTAWGARASPSTTTASRSA